MTETSPEWRAVAVNIPAERAVGGDVKAGDHVDVFVSVEIKVLNQDAEGNYVDCGTVTASPVQCGHATKITFQDLEVLKASPDDDMYLFKVDLHQAEQIAHVIQEAPDAFTMALRPADDTRDVDTSQYGTTNDRIIMTYLYPVPQLLDLSKLFGPSPYPYPGASAIPGGGGPAGQPTPTPSIDPNASPTPQASLAPGESPAPSPEATPAP